MNERPTIKEGFVLDTDKAKAAAPTVEQQSTQPPMPPPMPAPEITPSPVEQPDAIQIEQDVWPVVVRLLYKPLQIPGGPLLKELSFREPRGSDINRYGNPCRVNQEGDVLIEERKMHYIMAALSGVQPPFLEMLDPRDWNSCAYRLRHFFAPDPRAWSLAQMKQ
jgi:hypothetical protein